MFIGFDIVFHLTAPRLVPRRSICAAMSRVAAANSAGPTHIAAAAM
jgi:hypothetical protein